MFRFFLFLFIINSSALFAQRNTPTTSNYLNTINAPDQKFTFYTIPLKRDIIPESDKFYHWYSSNEIKISQGGYSGKLLNGLFSKFYSNKNLEEQGNFTSGLKTGKWKKWTEAGFLTESTSWRRGDRNGRFHYYDSLGNISQTGRYKNDQLHGKIKSYVDQDSTSVQYYKNGKIRAKRDWVPPFVRRLFHKKEGEKE